VGRSTIVVEVWDNERNVRQEYAFGQTPVRVGRSPLNDLPLDRPFVSHCHGVLHMEGATCLFVDLGSTNGSFLRGSRLSKNQPTPLAPADRLQIGSLELRVRKSEARGADVLTSYAFRPSQMNVELPAELPPSPASSTPASSRAREETHDVLPRGGQRGAPDHLTPLYLKYRSAWSALMTAVQADTPRGQNPEDKAAELLARFPELAQEAEFRRWLGTDRSSLPAPSSRPSAPPAAAYGERLASLLRVPPQYSQDPQFLERLAGVVERFAQAFLELRRGQRQFTKEAELSLAGRGQLDELEAANSLIAYLLDPKAAPGRLDELSRAYADLMLHQVALLNGFAAGARDILEELSPFGLERRHKGPVRSLLRLFGVDSRWRNLRQRYEDLLEETALSKVLLGRGFARAYTAAVGDSGDAKASTRYDTGPV
jgi:type VI secretion system protein ImpI